MEDIYKDQLTIEHVPPKSLKGKPIVLTTKPLNSESGHTLDTILLDCIKSEDFKIGKGGIATKFLINNEIHLKGEVKIAKDPHLIFKSKGLHEGMKRFLKLMESQETTRFQFKIKKNKDPEIAFLRTAYLLAFSNFGYSFLFGGLYYVNPNSRKIREQIIAHENKIIKNIPILKEEFSNDFLGANIIYEPKELRSVLIVFDLMSETSKYRFGVILPGPDDYGFQALECFTENIKKDRKVDIKAYTFPEKLHLDNPEDSIAFLKIWEQLNGWTKI